MQDSKKQAGEKPVDQLTDDEVEAEFKEKIRDIEAHEVTHPQAPVVDKDAP